MITNRRAGTASSFVSQGRSAHWTLSGLTALSGCLALLACSPGTGGADGAGGLASTGGMPAIGSGGGAAVGSGGAGPILSSGGNNSTIDLGDSGGASGVGSAAGLGTNGGYIELTTEQAADIKGSQCGEKTVGVQPVPAVIEFVIDVSDSMGQDVNGDTIVPDSGVQSKWEITQPALQAAVDGLGDDVYVGMQFYPSRDAPQGGPPGTPAEACVDETTAHPIAQLGPPGSPQRTLLANAIATTPLSYGTPTHDAMVFALDNGLAAHTDPGDKVLILITDGAPAQELGCGLVSLDVDPQPIIDEVAAAATEGITTFIIGSPGSQTSMSMPPEDMRPWLSDAAIAGGTDFEGCSSAGPAFCHFDMTAAPDFGVALTAALAEIGGAVAETCTFTAPPESGDDPLEFESTTVIMTRADQTSTLVLPDADADCAQGGWTLGAANEVILCPATCDLFQAQAGTEVSLSIGCDVIIK